MCSSEKFLIIYNYLSFVKILMQHRLILSSFHKKNFSFIHPDLPHTFAVLFYL